MKTLQFSQFTVLDENDDEGMVSEVLLTYKREAIGIMLTPVLSR